MIVKQTPSTTIISLIQVILASCCILMSCVNEEKKPRLIDAKDTTKVKVNLPSENSEIPPTEKSQQIEWDSSISTAYLIGQFNPAKDENFTLIDKKYASRTGMFIHKQTYEAFQQMADAAKKVGVSLIIKSATRPFNAQKRIWEEKWTGKRLIEGGQNIAKTIPDHQKRALKILEYSSMPGTSRHHWGTDIDINNFTNEYFAKGKGLKEYQWLEQHASSYGFCQPYTAKGDQRPDGYQEEKWHWSFLPIARKLTQQYKLRLDNKDIKGFKGSSIAKDIQVVEKYVLGINNACL